MPESLYATIGSQVGQNWTRVKQNDADKFYRCGLAKITSFTRLNNYVGIERYLGVARTELTHRRVSRRKSFRAEKRKPWRNPRKFDNSQYGCTTRSECPNPDPVSVDIFLASGTILPRVSNYSKRPITPNLASKYT